MSKRKSKRLNKKNNVDKKAESSDSDEEWLPPQEDDEDWITSEEDEEYNEYMKDKSIKDLLRFPPREDQDLDDPMKGKKELIIFIDKKKNIKEDESSGPTTRSSKKDLSDPKGIRGKKRSKEDELEDNIKNKRRKTQEKEDEELIGSFFNALFTGGGQGGNYEDEGDQFEELKKKIKKSSMTPEMKKKVEERLKESSLESKEIQYFKNFLKIPFGKYAPLPIDIKKDDVEKYFTNLMETLNKTVYGLENVKEEIVNYVAQCLTNPSPPAPRMLALQGGAGCGKTKIVRNGISKTLNRPMKCFSMGGIRDSSHFLGFDYTYLNSKHGAIAQSLMDSEVMNPVFFFDELDKISGTHEGEEIENLLIHMTDPVQNNDFRDKFFYEFPIDLSKVIFIFAFNDLERINPILKDRLHIIKIPQQSEKDQLIITKNYVIDELLENMSGIDRKDFSITDEAINYMIQKYSNKDGIRNVKRCVETILLKVNTIKLLQGKNVKLSFIKSSVKEIPLVINRDNIDIFLKSHDNYEDKAYLSSYM